MMNSFNKTILAGIVAAAFCAPAFSDETTAPAPVPVAASVEAATPATPAAPVAVVKKQDITSKLPKDLVEDLKNSGDHNKEIDDLVRLKALAQAQSDLARAELDRDKARIELKRLSEPTPSATPEVAAGAGMTPPPLQALPASVTSSKAEPEAAKVEESTILDDIYVTRLYVFGDKKSATVYIKNSVTTVEIGEEVAAGVTLVEVADRSATFKYKGKKRTVRLSTQEQAYGRSYDVSKSNQGQQGMMQQLSRSQMPPPLPAMPAGMSMGMGGPVGNSVGQSSGGPLSMPSGMSMPTMPTPSAGAKSNSPPGF